MSGLRQGDLDPDPLRQFSSWFADARAAGIAMPEAMALATASTGGTPSARMVLLKGHDERGFVFYTNYDGRKARELDANPRAALLFYWEPPGRQVRIEGEVERVPEDESRAYFQSRPRGSQIGAWASPQSRVIGSREELETRVAGAAARFGGGDVPLPPFWGGFRLRPHELEFWQHRDDRLHDRSRYTRAREGWTIERLAP